MNCDVLIETLEELADVYRQGSAPSDTNLPSHFFTYWNTASPDTAQYNNTATASIWQYTVYLYTTNPSELFSLLDEAREKLIEAGFEVDGRGYDIRSDNPSYFGRALDVYYYERDTEDGNT